MKNVVKSMGYCVILTASLLFSTPLFAKSHEDLNPCELITRQEAEAIMGEPLKEGQVREQKATGMKFCLYEASVNSSFAMLQVSVLQGAKAETIFFSIRDNFPDREQVDTMGDEAFLASPGLHILKGENYLTIAAGNLAKKRDRLFAAGKTAVAKLH